jgi:hypothetical protein
MLLRVLLCLLVLGAAVGHADIAIEGVQDKQVLADRATIQVVPVEGFFDRIRLNGEVIAGAAAFEVVEPDYHELTVERRRNSDGSTELRRVRFIIRASQRGDTEWGLPPWTPLPVIQSARGEFAGSQLRLITPAAVIAGLTVPLIAVVEDADRQPFRVNGMVSGAGVPAFQLRRGYGSTLLSVDASAPATLTAEVGGVAAAKERVIESDPVWLPVAGVITDAQSWPANARIELHSNLVVSAGAELRVGAGSIIKLAAGVELHISGKFVVNGTTDQPVLFAPTARSAPWGGFVLRTNSAELRMAGAILTGAGAHPDWFGANPGSGDSHRHEQPVIYVANGARAELTDCYLVDNPGQAAHGEDGILMMTDCLVHRCITTGQFNGGAVRLQRSAFIEFPQDTPMFADADNDALYFTQGVHALTNCLVGWAKDDGIDAGSGGAGEVTVEGCWIESCFHEGLAWSGTGRIARPRNTVIMNCGQGIEAGWNSPDVLADHCLAIGNVVGARFGDNYNWTYAGFLRVTNSFLLFNYRDVWGRQWSDWTERLERMDLQGNYLSRPDGNHPTNSTWTAADGPKLAPFIMPNPDSDVGVGFALTSFQLSRAELGKPVRIGLSRFSTQAVSVRCVAESARGILASAVMEFMPGEVLKEFPLASVNILPEDIVWLSLVEPAHAEVTGRPVLVLPGNTSAGGPLIPKGAEWKFWDKGSLPGTNWTASAFDDAAWAKGPAKLGFGDGDEATVINGGPSTNRFTAAYFRHQFNVSDPTALSGLGLALRRDDGAVVHLNGREVFRSNMPTGAVEYATLALSSSTSETTFFTAELSPELILPGVNVLAVEVHQSGVTSTDLGFDLELASSTAPKLQHAAMAGGRHVLYWLDAGYELERAAAVTGPWVWDLEKSGPKIIEGVGTSFYRLRRR